MATITLTDAQVQLMVENESDVKRLTDAEVTELAKAINDEVDIIVIDDKSEQLLLEMLVRAVDAFLYENLSREQYKLFRDTHDGISEKEAEKLAQVLAEFVIDCTPLPAWGPKWLLKKAVRALIKLLIDAMRKDNDVTLAIAARLAG